MKRPKATKPAHQGSGGGLQKIDRFDGPIASNATEIIRQIQVQRIVRRCLVSHAAAGVIASLAFEGRRA